MCFVPIQPNKIKVRIGLKGAYFWWNGNYVCALIMFCKKDAVFQVLITFRELGASR